MMIKFALTAVMSVEVFSSICFAHTPTDTQVSLLLFFSLKKFLFQRFFSLLAPHQLTGNKEVLVEIPGVGFDGSSGAAAVAGEVA